MSHKYQIRTSTSRYSREKINKNHTLVIPKSSKGFNHHISFSRYVKIKYSQPNSIFLLHFEMIVFFLFLFLVWWLTRSSVGVIPTLKYLNSFLIINVNFFMFIYFKNVSIHFGCYLENRYYKLANLGIDDSVILQEG